MTCLCSASGKHFLLVGSDHNLDFVGMKNECNKTGGRLAAELVENDYEIINSCIPTNQRQNYKVGLVFYPDSRTVCHNNSKTPYYWGSLPRELRSCVNGAPLKLRIPTSAECHLASVIPGSSQEIYNNVSWRLCNESEPYICQIYEFEERQTITSFPLCDRVVSATYLHSATPTSKSFNSTSAIFTAANMPQNIASVVGAAVASFIVVLLIGLLVFRRYRRHRQKKAKVLGSSSTKIPKDMSQRKNDLSM